MHWPDDDPVLGEAEPVRLETDTGTYSFRAVVEERGGVIRISPVPERVSPGGVGYGVTLTAESVPSGDYCWGDHTITPAETKVVRLTRWDKRGGGSQ